MGVSAGEVDAPMGNLPQRDLFAAAVRRPDVNAVNVTWPEQYRQSTGSLAVETGPSYLTNYTNGSTKHIVLLISQKDYEHYTAGRFGCKLFLVVRCSEGNAVNVV